MEEQNKMYKYRAFISYSHKDKAFAKWLHKRIENYKIPKSLREKYPHLPKDLKRSIFRDEEELPTSSVLGDNLRYALDHSKKLIVICSPFSVASKWVNEEIRYFKEVHGEFSVLAIITSGEPKSSNAKEEAFPKSLRYVVGEDGELTDKETEPLAGDARKGNDKEMALMKLIAGVLEVDFADLWEREKREARKRKFILSAVIVAFVALAFFVQLQSHAISSTEELKLIEREIIKTEYKLKEEKDSSVIKQLRKRLKELKEQEKNKQATLKQFGLTKTKLAEEAKNEYDKGDKKGAIAILESKNKDTTNEQLLLARIYIEEHQYKKAKKSYKVATLLECSYNNILEYANFLSSQKDFQEIESLYEKLDLEYLPPAKQSCITHNLGKLYATNNQLVKSEEVYKKALKVRRALAKTNPSAYNSAVATTLYNLATLYKKMNRMKEAEEIFLEALEINKALSQKKPLVYNSTIATTLNSLANLYSKENRVKEAKEVYLEALKLRRALAETNSSVYNSDLAMTLNNLALLYYKINRLKDAEEAYLEALTLRRALAKTNPSAYNFDVAMTLNNLAGLYDKVNRVKEAKEIYLEALDFFRALAKKNPTAYNYYIAGMLNNLTLLLHNKLNQVKEAEEAYFEALKLSRALAKENPSAYGITLATSLFIGVVLLNQPMENLDEAEAILQQFKGIPQAERLLGIIQKIRNKR